MIHKEIINIEREGRSHNRSTIGPRTTPNERRYRSHGCCQDPYTNRELFISGLLSYLLSGESDNSLPQTLTWYRETGFRHVRK